MMRDSKEKYSPTALSSRFMSGYRSLRVALLANASVNSRQVQQWISESGNECVCYLSSRRFQESLPKVVFDAVIIDCDATGGKVDSNMLRWIRGVLSIHVPVLVISQSHAEQDVVSALYSGADGFLVKPLRRNEFLARLQALSRRTHAKPEHLVLHPYTLDLCNREIRNEGVVVNLTHLEYELTVFLFRHRGVVLSREQLLASVWRMQTRVDTRTVDTHISRLRMKLKIKSSNRWILSSVYQRGYRLRRHIIAAKVLRPAVAVDNFAL